ncbi:hypothetical protein G9A89_007747 [Geosiphon pyriformis]|nr:hypothetical protein G9A89_007747 [Geosiphon pyriformis]
MNQLGHRVDHAVSTRIITADRATKTPIGEINNFLIKVDSIIIPIKVLVIEAIQYQAFNTQELQLRQNEQHTRVPATCGHFKTTTTASLIEFEKEKKKPIWKAYQVSWADTNHNELLPILY